MDSPMGQVPRSISIVLWCISKSVDYPAIAAPLMTLYLNYYELYVFCQLPANNKLLAIPSRTSFDSFKNNYTCALYRRYFI